LLGTCLDCEKTLPVKQRKIKKSNKCLVRGMNDLRVWYKNGASLCLVCKIILPGKICDLRQKQSLFFSDVKICKPKTQADKFSLAESCFKHYFYKLIILG